MTPTHAAITLLALGLAPPEKTQEKISLTFAVPDGTVLRKEWSTEHTLVMTGLTRGTADVTARRTDLSVALSTRQRVALVDEYRRVSGGRPLELRRTYESAELSASQTYRVEEPPPPIEVTLKSAFSGHSVVFTWVEEEQGYGRYYDARELKEVWLPDLAEDTDLRCLLPAGPVTVGEGWSVPAAALGDLLAHGGDLHMEAGEVQGQAARMLVRTLGVGVGGALQQAFGGQSTGEARVRLEAVLDDDGPVARLAVELDDLRYLADISEYADEHSMRVEVEGGLERTSGRLALDLSGKGTLLWDLAAQRARSFELTADERVSLRVVLQADEQTGAYEDAMVLSGILRLRVQVAPCPPPPAPPSGR